MGKRKKLEESFQQIIIDPPPKKSSFETVASAPVLEILDAEKKPTKHLQVAKMQGALNSAIVANKTGVTLDIDKDVDRFYIQLRDASAKENEIMVDLITKNPDSDYNEKAKVLLTKKQGEKDVFESKSLMLVSNKTDDEFAIGKVVDNDLNGRDRTFKVALGGKVQVEHPTKNIFAMAKVPVEKNLNINLVILKRDDGQQANREDIYRQFKEANETFAQAGIKINLNVKDKEDIPIKELPEGVDLSDGLDDDERDIIFRKLGTPNKDDVHIFYTGSSPSNREGRIIGGFALMRGPDDLMNNIVLGEECLNMSTLAHEIGHLIRGWREHDKNEYHYPFDKETKPFSPEELAEVKLNLMFRSCTAIPPDLNPIKSIFDSKRLTSEDEKEWHKSPLLKDPESKKQSLQEKEDEQKEKINRLVMR
jgi:hypothetical protein